VATVIIINAAVLALASDEQMLLATHGTDGEPSQVFSYFEVAFTCFFLVEICLRIIGGGVAIFWSNDWSWYIFDLSLVLYSVLELLSVFGGNASFLRIMRLMKMLKILRVVRLARMFKELRLIIHSIMGCVSSMIWSMILLFAIIFIFVIVFIQGCTMYMSEGNVPEKVDQEIQQYWGTIFKSMLSLFMAGTGGLDWDTAAKPLLEVGKFFYGLFLLYIIFFTFVVVNTLMSLFVAATMAHSGQDKVLHVQEEMNKKQEHLDRCAELFEELDGNGDGTINAEEFNEGLTLPLMADFCKSLGLEVTDAIKVFKVLSHDSGSVSMEDFVVECMHLKGEARALDLYQLQQQQEQVLRHVTRLERKLIPTRGSLTPRAPLGWQTE